MEEAGRREQRESWSLGHEGAGALRKALVMWECRTVHPADSRGRCGRKTQRNREAERLPQFIKGSHGTGSPSVPKGSCLGVSETRGCSVNLGGLLLTFLPECANVHSPGPSDEQERGGIILLIGAGLPVTLLVTYIWLFGANKSKATLLSHPAPSYPLHCS